MKGYAQLLADISGRCAAVFLKIQLYFIGREKARLERRYGRRPNRRADDGDDSVATSVVRLLPPAPGPRGLASCVRRGRDHVA